MKKALASQRRLGANFSDQGLHYLECSLNLIDQVDRRLLKGEKIPHSEKIFSVHEPHTRWISKGKAGAQAELGLPICVLEDQHQLCIQINLPTQ